MSQDPFRPAVEPAEPPSPDGLLRGPRIPCPRRRQLTCSRSFGTCYWTSRCQDPRTASRTSSRHPESSATDAPHRLRIASPLPDGRRVDHQPLGFGPRPVSFDGPTRNAGIASDLPITRSSTELIPPAVSAASYGVRTCLDDKTLVEELPGYREYARQIRYRLLPGLW